MAVRRITNNTGARRDTLPYHRYPRLAEAHSEGSRMRIRTLDLIVAPLPALVASDRTRRGGV